MICDKESFVSHKEAVQRIISLSKRKKNHKYNLYKCRYCGGYHITTSTKYLREQQKKKKAHRVDKYPVHVPAVKRPKDNKFKPVKFITERSLPYATQPMISPLQAEILKHIVEHGRQ